MRVDYIAFNEEFINILNTLAAPTKTLVEERERQTERKRGIPNGVTCL